MKISTKLVYQYMVIFFNFSPTSSHLRPLQVGNCDSNSRLVVDEDDNGKLMYVIKHFNYYLTMLAYLKKIFRNLFFNHDFINYAASLMIFFI